MTRPLSRVLRFLRFSFCLSLPKVLAGDNKFLCAQCDEKRVTLKRTCIARLPNVLFLHLKRFEFDMMDMRKVCLRVNETGIFSWKLITRAEALVGSGSVLLFY